MFLFRAKTLIAFCLLSAVFSVFSCKSSVSENNDNSSLLDFSSDSDKARELITEANNEMNRIKILYNDNQIFLKELKQALDSKDWGKVETISNALAYVITDGFVFADTAKTNIRKAQELNIDQDYKDYLSMEEQGIDKQIEAFQSLYDAAQLLHDTSNSQENGQTEARLKFKEMVQNFEKKMEEAKQINAEADKLWKIVVENRKK